MEMVWRMIETRAWVGERSAVAEGERSGGHGEDAAVPTEQTK